MAYLTTTAQAACGVDLTTLFGILGTLVGGLGGAGIAWKIQKRQLEHADKTRFHDQRLELYSQYTSALCESVSAWKRGEHISKFIDDALYSAERIKLIASDSTDQAAQELHSAFYELMIENQKRVKASLILEEEACEPFYDSLKNFRTVAREELNK